MKATITAACGHTVNVQFFGKKTSLPERIAQQQADVCFECKRADPNHPYYAGRK